MPKCRFCKVELIEGERVVLKGVSHYSHPDCFMEVESEKKGSSKDQIEKFIEEHMTEIKKSKKQIDSQQKIDKDILLEWAMREYDILTLPKQFFIKIASINNGTFRGLREPIPYKELYDMLQRKKGYLDRTLASKKFDDNVGRLNYDIAVVINKYASYKKWKLSRQLEIEAIKEQAIEQQESLKQNTYNNIQHSKVKPKKEMCIGDLVDDIFGGD